MISLEKQAPHTVVVIKAQSVDDLCRERTMVDLITQVANQRRRVSRFCNSIGNRGLDFIEQIETAMNVTDGVNHACLIMR